MSEYLENVRVFSEESSNGDVESDDVFPARHELNGDERAALSRGDEAVEGEDEGEFVEVGCEFVELEVSGSAL